MKHSVGRYVFSLAAIGSCICALTWHQFDVLGDASLRPIFIYVLATIEILGGVAIQWTRRARAGALAVGTFYLASALLGVPFILKHSLVYIGYGNFFEQFSFVVGAVILYACSGPINSARSARLAMIGYYSSAFVLLRLRWNSFSISPQLRAWFRNGSRLDRCSGRKQLTSRLHLPLSPYSRA